MHSLRLSSMLLVVVLWFSPHFQSRMLGSELACHTSLPINAATVTFSEQTAGNLIQLAKHDLGNNINSFELTPSGNTLVVITSANAQIYSLGDDPAEIDFLEECRPIDKIAFSSDGTKAAVVTHDTTSIELWDVSTSSLLETMVSTGNQITSVTFSQMGDLLAWADSDVDQIGGDPWVGNGTVIIYSLEKQAQILMFQDVADVVTHLQFTPDGELIVFRGLGPGYGSNMQVWDTETETRQAIREAWSVIPAYAIDVSTIALSVTESLGITDEYLYQLEFWNTQTDSVSLSIAVPRNPNRLSYAGYARIPALALNSDATLLATGNDEGFIMLWNGNTGALLTTLKAYTDQVQQLAFSRNGQYLLAIGANDTMQSLQVWGVIR